MSKIDVNNLGHLRRMISPYVFSESILNEIDRLPNQVIIGLGQGGGRMAAELSRCGHPTYLFNSSKSDLNEHKNLIPDDRRIETPSKRLVGLEGTDKNAKLGFEIAKENIDLYKQVAIQPDVQLADFVWVTVSLGGGSGNGALKVIMEILSKVRERKQLPGGKIPLGVICSLPSTDERGVAFRDNALAGIYVIQDLMAKGKMGAALVIDNEKLKDYYENGERVQGVDARSYTNMVVASTLYDTAALPLLEGRSVYDKTELLSTWSTPGWLSVSKRSIPLSDDVIYKAEIENLFKRNEVLANYRLNNVLTGAIAVIYPNNRKISPQIADDIYRDTSEILNTRVNHAISKNDRLYNEILLYGLAVVSDPPLRIEELKHEREEWQVIEEEQKRAREQTAAGLSDYNDFFSTNTSTNTNQGGLLTLDDLDERDTEDKPAALADLSDLDDLDL
ncbi:MULTISPECIES: cell division protein FtsZ [Paenibacillus]|uniref:Cell division protein FtsZ n=2 Tax=Paenibacillus TaxID=44249 RepID=A0A7Y6BS52_9BACL|nr:MULTISPECIES: cell division protein FtsZ [Paenibacillus]KGP77463.1 cell division protein FtsZ [Paenibacillus sp. MAEPY1]KGP78422.1 cell division protein FtsZ [Paenibacillus sp. MAEPY2]MDN4604023.1 cell division protein FtsZ [Paenibacillus vandeheii]NUU73949.1 cell division protein FtsZ [Paenibacillus xylanilyticus]